MANSDLLSFYGNILVTIKKSRYTICYSKFESIGSDVFTSLTRDNLQVLSNTWNNLIRLKNILWINYHMFKSTVLSFSVFSQCDDVNIIVERFNTRKRFSWSNIGKEVQLLSKSDVYWSIAFTNWSCEWAFIRFGSVLL